MVWGFTQRAIKLYRKDKGLIDIILWHMTHYRNLTYKHIMGLKWVSTHCSNAHTVVKVDDDTFVNIFQLTTFLKNDGYFSALNSKGMYMTVYFFAF